MKRQWTRGEKLLWATPILVGVFAAAIAWGPQLARGALGMPQVWTTTSDTSIRSMALSANGEILAAGGSRDDTDGNLTKGSGTVYLWNARTGEKLSPIAQIYTRDKTGYTVGWDIYALAFPADAGQIGFSRLGADWTLYDMATRKLLWRFPHFITDAEFSPDKRFIALSDNFSVWIVNASDGKIRAQWKRDGSASSSDVAWSPDGEWVANIGAYETSEGRTMQDSMLGIYHYEGSDPIEIHRADNGKLVRRIPNVSPYPSLNSVAFSPDGKQIVSASNPQSSFSRDDRNKMSPIRCYDAATGKLQWEIKGASLKETNSNREFFFGDAIFSPDGRTVAACQSLQHRILLLDSATGEIKATRQLRGAKELNAMYPPKLFFAPDGKRLFVGGNNAVLVWDLD